MRGCVALLVVLHHTAIIYGGQGGWFYKEVLPSGRLSSLLLTFFCASNQAWFMGLFFLLAGYYTPGAAAHRSTAVFLRDRLLRLGLPTLAFALLLHPLTIALAQTAKGFAFWPMLQSLYGKATFGLGPMWFAFTLLIFTGLWLAFGRFAPPLRSFPTNAALLVAALSTGVAAFLLRLVWPVGLSYSGLQFGYFASYVVLYAAGCMAAHARLLERIPPDEARVWRRIAWLALPVLPVAAVVFDAFGWLPGPFDGGWSVRAVIYAFWEPFVAWGIILGLLVAFQRRFTSLDGAWARLARRAFAIYVIHPPIVTGIAVIWRDVAAPPLVKFAATGAAACLVCYLAAGLLLRAPAVNRVL